METMIKSAAIFTILCEMLIFLLPNQAYEKYFRFLTNLLLLLLILESVTGWFSTENKSSILSRVNELEQELDISVEEKISDYHYDFLNLVNSSACNELENDNGEKAVERQER